MITNFMEQLARYFECFVLGIHHTGKDQAKGARGSSAFHANLDTIISMKLKAGGAEMKVRKHKDADASDDVQWLRVKEVGSSIVLEKSNDAPPSDERGKKTSRYAWASVSDVVAMLNGLGGKAVHDMLCMEISKTYNVDLQLVRRQLKDSPDLAFLRPDARNWAIPSQEFDL